MGGIGWFGDLNGRLLVHDMRMRDVRSWYSMSEGRVMCISSEEEWLIDLIPALTSNQTIPAARPEVFARRAKRGKKKYPRRKERSSSRQDRIPTYIPNHLRISSHPVPFKHSPMCPPSSQT